MAVPGTSGRGLLLDPVDRISEILFGLIMAVTIVGSLSVATAGTSEIHTVMMAAIGCNLAWGLVDAVMYLVQTVTERTRNRALALRIVTADEDEAHRLIEIALPEHVAAIAGPEEIEGMRRRLLALKAEVHGLALIRPRDVYEAAAVFLWVVFATFPVVLPFVLVRDPPLAMDVSRIVALCMLFLAGLALGRHAGHPRPLWTGLSMAALGTVLIATVKALGG